MIKARPKRNPIYIGILIGVYSALVIAVMVLAGISNSTGFWIAAIIIDLIIIAIGILTFIKLFKPKYFSAPIGETLQYDEDEEQIEESK